MAEKDNSQSSSDNSPPPPAFCSGTFSSSTSKEPFHHSSLSSNPFVIKTNNTNDVTDEEAKPLIAPLTLKLNDSDSSTEQLPQSSLTPKFVLRPSRLAVQTEKLEHATSSEKDEKTDENDTDNQGKDSEETKGSPPVPQLFTTGISTSGSNVFSVAKKSSDSSHQNEDESGGNFVFGQNLHERALNYDSSDPEVTLSPAKSHDLTFEEAAQKNEESSVKGQENDNAARSLSESAREYESKQSKRKYDEISVITGEEGESNALQITCKLFEFNMVEKSWQERGKGILRLNDQMCDGVLNSRVVMRTQGNLRVVLNTKVWPGMTVQHPSEKKVQLSAIDSEGVRVFLVMARPKDADQLYSALDWRVSSLKSKGESSNGDENNSAAYESASSESQGLNGNQAKRLRSNEVDTLESFVKYNSGESEEAST